MHHVSRLPRRRAIGNRVRAVHAPFARGERTQITNNRVRGIHRSITEEFYEADCRWKTKRSALEIFFFPRGGESVDREPRSAFRHKLLRSLNTKARVHRCARSCNAAPCDDEPLSSTNVLRGAGEERKIGDDNEGSGIAFKPQQINHTNAIMTEMRVAAFLQLIHAGQASRKIRSAARRTGERKICFFAASLAQRVPLAERKIPSACRTRSAPTTIRTRDAAPHAADGMENRNGDSVRYCRFDFLNRVRREQLDG